MELNEVIEQYKAKALEEIVNGPSRKTMEKFEMEKCLKPNRPYFQKLDPNDENYVKIFRISRLAAAKTILGLEGTAALHYKGGFELGRQLVKQGKVKELNDITNAFVELRIGIPVLIKEIEEEKIIDVYECITGSGVPNIGRPICSFEGGILAGIFTELEGTLYVALETHCWGKGYSFCRFRIYPL